MGKQSKDELLDKIEDLRGKLHSELNNNSDQKELTGDNLLSISKSLDELIVKYMNKKYKVN